MKAGTMVSLGHVSAETHSEENRQVFHISPPDLSPLVEKLDKMDKNFVIGHYNIREDTKLLSHELQDVHVTLEDIYKSLSDVPVVIKQETALEFQECARNFDTKLAAIRQEIASATSYLNTNMAQEFLILNQSVKKNCYFIGGAAALIFLLFLGMVWGCWLHH